MSEFQSTLREVLAAGHIARFCASGDSMYPTIRSGDYLHIVRCQMSDLRRGDVVLAAAERGLTAHRIVRITERDGSIQITTRGDNALRCDPLIRAEDVIGRVVSIERSGGDAVAIGNRSLFVRFVVTAARRLRARLRSGAGGSPAGTAANRWRSL